MQALHPQITRVQPWAGGRRWTRLPRPPPADIQDGLLPEQTLLHRMVQEGLRGAMGTVEDGSGVGSLPCGWDQGPWQRELLERL